MIESLHISGFKLFRDITLPRLGRLNLFVGENNSGKSCLLEAINLYAGWTPVSDILQAAAERSGDRMRPWEMDLIEEGTSLTHPIFELFRRTGRHITPRITIGTVGDPSALRVEFGPHRAITNEEGLTRYVPLAPADVFSEGAELALPVYRGDRQVGLVTRRTLPLRGRIAGGENRLGEDSLSAVFVRAIGLSKEKAASMWDALVQGPGQEVVLDWLRILDPRIEDLAYIAGKRPYERLALLRIEGQGRLPLQSMGDGLTKLFHIALAAASASQRVLLIDEFENGLHWSVQEKLWKAIAKAACDFNVQVFATTHSRDCIEAFAAAAKDAGPDGAAIYRLERKGDDVIATDLPLLNVDAAMRQHGEIR
jgi:predicted ATPase